VLALIAWSLATSFLPFGWPGHSDGTYWLAALAAAGVSSEAQLAALRARLGSGGSVS
jgi:hypothetical protein